MSNITANITTIATLSGFQAQATQANEFISNGGLAALIIGFAILIGVVIIIGKFIK